MHPGSTAPLRGALRCVSVEIHSVFLPHAPCQPGASPLSALTQVPPQAASAPDTSNREAAEDTDDFYKCSEDDGGDDDGSICDAEWVNEVEVTFADGTFGCEASRMVSITCEWDADGGMARGRNALPEHLHRRG